MVAFLVNRKGLGNPRVVFLFLIPGTGIYSVLRGFALHLKVCILGMLLYPGLMLDRQVAVVDRGSLRQLHLFLGRKDLTTVAQALVMSRLNYCNALHMGLTLKAILYSW